VAADRIAGVIRFLSTFANLPWFQTFLSSQAKSDKDSACDIAQICDSSDKSRARFYRAEAGTSGRSPLASPACRPIAGQWNRSQLHIVDKPKLIRDIVSYFRWTCSDDLLSNIVEQVDIRVEVENPK
jgi:hypothetical protein